MESAETSWKSGLICSFFKILISVLSDTAEREKRPYRQRRLPFCRLPWLGCVCGHPPWWFSTPAWNLTPPWGWHFEELSSLWQWWALTGFAPSCTLNLAFGVYWHTFTVSFFCWHHCIGMITDCVTFYYQSHKMITPKKSLQQHSSRKVSPGRVCGCKVPRFGHWLNYSFC